MVHNVRHLLRTVAECLDHACAAGIEPGYGATHPRQHCSPRSRAARLSWFGTADLAARCRRRARRTIHIQEFVMSRPVRLAAFVAATLLIPSLAFAHAFLHHASPPVGSEIPVSPPALIITYTEGVEPKFSTIEVDNAQGTRVDKADPHLVGGDQTKLAVSLPKLPPGRYTVIWHATSVDTHKTEGRFNFSVSP